MQEIWFYCGWGEYKRGSLGGNWIKFEQVTNQVRNLRKNWLKRWKNILSLKFPNLKCRGLPITWDWIK